MSKVPWRVVDHGQRLPSDDWSAYLAPLTNLAIPQENGKEIFNFSMFLKELWIVKIYFLCTYFFILGISRRSCYMKTASQGVGQRCDCRSYMFDFYIYVMKKSVPIL